MDRLLSVITFLGCVMASLAEEAVTSRQSVNALGGLINASTLSSIITTVAPVLLAMGLGALFIPLVAGMFVGYREGRAFKFPKITPEFVDKVTDTLERVARALEEVDKKY